MPVREYIHSLPKDDIITITADLEDIRDNGILKA